MMSLEVSYREGESWLKVLLGYLEENYCYLVDFFSKYIPEIIPNNIEGTYLVWLDCRKLNLDQKGLFDLFVVKAGLGLVNGEQYGEAGKGFMRLNFGCPRKLLSEALNRIRTAVNGR